MIKFTAPKDRVISFEQSRGTDIIDTPLDISLARRILRNMSDAAADDIRRDLEIY